MKDSRSLVALSALLLAACGSDDPKDVTLPSAAVTFPATKAYTTAATSRLVGTASDDAGPVSAVTVNGQPVTTTDNFATWSIDVTLAQGVNTFTVAVTDAAGNVATAAATASIERRADIENIAGLEADAAGEKLYFVDVGGRAIRMLTLADRSIVDVADISQFFNGAAPLDLALDLANNRIFLGVRANSGTGSTIGVWAYNTQARTWSAFSDAQTPANGGPALTNPTDLVLDSSRQRLYVVDWVGGVYSINLANGQRTVLSSNTVPSTANALFSEPMDAALDSTGGRLLVLDRATDALFSVDLTSGARTVISRTGSQTGPSIGFPLALSFSAQNNVAYTWDGSMGVGDGRGVMRIDLATGARTALMTNADLPAASPISLYQYDVRGMALVGNDLIGIDNSAQAATRMTPGTAVRTLVSSNAFPRSTPIRSAYDTVFAGGKTYLSAPSGEIIEIAANGTERVVAGAGVTGSSAIQAYVMALDAAAQVIYAATYVNGVGQVYRVNVTNGAVTLVNDGAAAPGGTTLGYVNDMVLDAAAGKLYVASTNDVIEVITLSTGARTRLSVANPSVPLQNVTQLALDTRGNRLLVSDNAAASLIAVDLTSGAHSAFSDAGSSGPAFTFTSGVTVDSDGAIWTVGDAIRLLRIDRATGARTQVSATVGNGSDAGSGMLVSGFWTGLAVDGGALLIHDTAGAVLQVDRSTGARVAVARGSSGDNNS